MAYLSNIPRAGCPGWDVYYVCFLHLIMDSKPLSTLRFGYPPYWHKYETTKTYLHFLWGDCGSPHKKGKKKQTTVDLMTFWKKRNYRQRKPINGSVGTGKESTVRGRHGTVGGWQKVCTLTGDAYKTVHLFFKTHTTIPFLKRQKYAVYKLCLQKLDFKIAKWLIQLSVVSGPELRDVRARTLMPLCSRTKPNVVTGK